MDQLVDGAPDRILLFGLFSVPHIGFDSWPASPYVLFSFSMVSLILIRLPCSYQFGVLESGWCTGTVL